MNCNRSRAGLASEGYMDQIVAEHLTLLICLPFVILAVLLATAWKIITAIAGEMRDYFRERLLLIQEVASLRDDVRDVRSALSKHVSEDTALRLRKQVEDLPGSAARRNKRLGRNTSAG